MKFSLEKKIVVQIAYISDNILTCDYKDDLLRLKKLIAKEFEIEDLGPLKYFQGVRVAPPNKGIFIP